LGRNTWIKQCREEDGDLPECIDDDPLKVSSRKTLHHRVINIGGKATVMMGKGDRLRIETPGGGAWGAIDKEEVEARSKENQEWMSQGREARQAEF
jgi:5-oxoprolinase (ATP-hydrolysing)